MIVGDLKIHIGLRDDASGPDKDLLTKVLFWGKYSEISGGRMPNKITGSTDYLTVAGSAGSETYQCPNTAPYIAADTDYIWFKTDASQRTTTTAELIGYDLQRTPVKYDDNTPNALRDIMILKAGEVLSASERNNLFQYMWLSILWDNVLNAYGHIKSNRAGQQLWTPELLYSAETLVLLARMDVAPSTALADLIDVTMAGLKSDGVLALGDCLYVRGLHTSQASLLNWIKNAHDSTIIGGITHTPKVGFTGAAGAALNNNYKPQTQGDKLTQNAASVFIKVNAISATTGRYIIGSMTGTDYLSISTYTAAVERGVINSVVTVYNGSADIVDNDILGYVRLDASSIQAYKNGVAQGVPALKASSGIPNSNMYELAYNADDGGGTGYVGGIGFSFYGGILDNTKQLALYNRIAYFYANVGGTF
jgi:hypothetical protein